MSEIVTNVLIIQRRSIINTLMNRRSFLAGTAAMAATPLMAQAALLLVATSILVGCKDSIEKQVRQSVLMVREFETLFPNSTGFLSYASRIDEQSIWNSEAGLHERYVLTFQIKVRRVADEGSIVAIGPPEFYLHEVERVETGEEESVRIRYKANQLTFGLDQWARLRAAGGDLEALGIRPVTDQPVKNFARALQGRSK